MKTILAVACVLATTLLLAHSPTETHTEARYDGGMLTLEIELPWSIAEAVKDAYPEMEPDLEKADFFKWVQLYTAENVVIRKDGERVKIENISDKEADHSHSAILVLSCKVDELKNLQISNTMLFSINPHQQNHHKVIDDAGNVYRFTTDHHHPSFSVGQEEAKAEFKSGAFWFWLIVAFLFPVAVWWGYGRNKKFSTPK